MSLLLYGLIGSQCMDGPYGVTQVGSQCMDGVGKVYTHTRTQTRRHKRVVGEAVRTRGRRERGGETRIEEGEGEGKEIS